MKRAILYYTCNTHRPEIDNACRRQLKKIGLPIVSVSLNKEIDFGDHRLVIPGQRSPEMMHEQVLRGLQQIFMLDLAEAVFFCESDVLYHPSHFDFSPAHPNIFYYNENVYKMDFFTGQSYFYYTKQVSGLCADLGLLLEHYHKRLDRIRQEGHFDRKIGYEPGCHQFPRGIDHFRAERWMSEFPNLDIRHDKNITKTKHSLDDFRDKRTAEGWKLVDKVPCWGPTKGRVNQLLEAI